MSLTTIAADQARPLASAAGARGRTADLLDRCLAELKAGQPFSEIANRLFAGLLAERHRLGAAWPSVMDHVCRRHPLYAVLGEDPLTARARAKPRGYAGDAVMIDYIYDGGLPASDAGTVSERGRALMAVTTASASGRSVRDRRELLASKIDACAVRVAKPSIFAVACGHLREVAASTAFANDALGAVYALDQDRESLDVVRSTYADRPVVRPIAATVRDLLRGSIDVPPCDLVYAAGLYDYLPDGVATQLTTCLFNRLAPGGELVIGNFVPDFPTVGYLEAFLDWTLLCRSQTELRQLCDGIAATEIAAVETWTDRSGCVAYVSIVRT